MWGWRRADYLLYVFSHRRHFSLPLGAVRCRKTDHGNEEERKLSGGTLSATYLFLASRRKQFNETAMYSIQKQKKPGRTFW